MKSAHSDREKLFQIAAACQEAIQMQHKRELGQGYGIDDYTEGRIVGSANFARRVLRIVSGDPTPEGRPTHGGSKARRL